MYKCKDGHLSDTPDCCSVCGGEVVASADPTAASTGEVCPNCHTAREVGGLLCEVCGYDFVNKPAPAAAAPTPAAPIAVANPAPAQIPTPPIPAVASAPASPSWAMSITQDAKLDIDPDPTTPCPNDPEQVVALDRPELLLGRASSGRGIIPDVLVHDPGVSHQHLKIQVLPNGSVAIQDLNSLNGTEVNGVPIPADTLHALQADDVVIIGRWTKITLRTA